MNDQVTNTKFRVLNTTLDELYMSSITLTQVMSFFSQSRSCEISRTSIRVIQFSIDSNGLETALNVAGDGCPIAELT